LAEAKKAKTEGGLSAAVFGKANPARVASAARGISADQTVNQQLPLPQKVDQKLPLPAAPAQPGGAAYAPSVSCRLLLAGQAVAGSIMGQLYHAAAAAALPLPAAPSAPSASAAPPLHLPSPPAAAGAAAVSGAGDCV